MNRREFVGNTLKAAIAGSVAAESSFLAERAAAVEVERKDPTISEPRRGVPADERSTHSRELDRHRFGANYTPSKDWWFCWNNWDADPIKSDLDARMRPSRTPDDSHQPGCRAKFRYGEHDRPRGFLRWRYGQ
jgi:hypothetical protein